MIPPDPLLGREGPVICPPVGVTIEDWRLHRDSALGVTIEVAQTETVWCGGPAWLAAVAGTPAPNPKFGAASPRVGPGAAKVVVIHVVPFVLIVSVA